MIARNARPLARLALLAAPAWIVLEIVARFA